MDWDRKLKVIVGLGNPDPKFFMNRHNIGFILVDAYSDYMKFENGIIKTSDDLAPLQIRYKIIDKSPVILVKPQDWMNDSGRTVWRITRTLKINTKQILVIHDDMDFDFGMVRIKPGGGSGRHNGIASIIKFCGDKFVRLRVGIGRPHGQSARDYVLSDFKVSEQKSFCELYSLAIKILDSFVIHGVDKTMSTFNVREK